MDFHLVASSPELSQRLFGLNIKTAINNNNNSNIKTNIQSTRCTSFGAAAAATTTSSTTTNAIPHQASTNPAMITMTQHQQKHKQQQHQQQQFQMPTELNGKSVQATPQPPTPPSLCKSGLKVKASLQNVSGSALNSTINNSMPMIATTMATSCPMQYLTTISSPSTSVSPSTSTCTSIIPVMSMNSNSLLKQQLRSGLKDINSNVGLGLSNFGGNSNSTSNTNGNGNGVSIVTSISDDIINSTMLNAHQKINDGTIIVKATGACTALQSLANAAETQANHNNNGNNNNINNNGNHIQPPTANNLHHQFMLHMAANPILKSSDEEQHQQHQQEHLIIKQDINDDINVDDDANERNMDYTLHQCDDKSDPEMLTLADESAGLNYTICNNNKTNNDNNNSQQQQQQPMMTLMKTESQVVTMTVTPSISTISNDNNTNSNVNKASNVTTTATITTVAEGPIAAAATTTTTAAAAATVTNRTKNATTKPIQRRRIRRKAQSSLEDPAEQLTEMSVRGLDLFRYASINEGVYQCTECAKENLQKTFKNKYSFQRHAFLYHEGKQRKVFPCTLCGKGFSRPDKMKNHIKMVHDVINFNSLNFLITAAATPPNERMPGPLSTPTTTRVTKKTGKSMQASSARNSVKATGKNYQLNSTRSLPSTATVPTPLPSVPAPPPQLSQPSTLQSSSTSGGNGGTVGTVGVSNASDNDTKFLIAPLTDDGTFSANVEIKNEIIISPSPSPPPLPTLNASQYAHSSNTTMHNKTKCHLKMSMSQTSPQQAASGNTTTPLTNSAQRLAEVK